MGMKSLYYLIECLEKISKDIVKLIFTIGKAGVFLCDILFIRVKFKKDFYTFVKQFYFIGVLSIGLIMISALFIGMVVGIQCYYIIQKFGTENMVGHVTSLTIVRELAPVVSSMLFTGRTGSSLTAEICLMKSTDQLVAMEMMGINSVRKVVVPRFWCGIFGMLFLTIIFIVVAIFGSYLAVVIYLKADYSAFWMGVNNSLSFTVDVLNSFLKSLIFGFIIVWIALFQGINSEATSEGIAKATTNTVVYSTFIILGVNFFLTAIMFCWK
jgi:phospholipid/cholesterol/gamma-HCH transport system permease protein